MSRFTAQNTDYQYTNRELAELNDAFDFIMERDDIPMDDFAYKSWQDHVSETLLIAYEEGKRGDDLKAAT